MTLATNDPQASLSPMTEHADKAGAHIAPPDQLISQPVVIASVLVYDSIVIAAVGVTSYLQWFVDTQVEMRFLVFSVFAVVCGVLAILRMRWAYTIPSISNGARQIKETGIALICALSALLVYLALFEDNLAPLRNWIVEWLALSWILCVIDRLVVAGFIEHWAKQGRLARRAVIVGGGELATELLTRLDRPDASDIHILGLFDDRDKTRSPENVGRHYKLGRFDDLEQFCREHRVDLLIIALPMAAEDRILHILKSLWVLPIDVRIAAIGSKLKLRSRSYNYIGEVPFLPVFDKPMSDWSVAAKAVEDRVLACLGLVLLSPLFALVALLIKLESRGPVFFKQVRYGFNNEKIEIYKFRSMYVDRQDVLGQNQVKRGDPRVTRVGRFIRRTSIDELPQLLNVAFIGNLSLVGPRPHAIHSLAANRFYEEVVDGYFARHRVKPGITGWAQINGWRGETDTEEKIEQRVAHDLYYIENWSALLDLQILLRTPISLITTKNAY